MNNYEKTQFAERLIAAMQAKGYEAKPSILEREFNLCYAGKSVTFACVSKWLKGAAIPSADKLLTLAEWLEVPPEELAFDKNIQKAIGAFERKLITPTKFDDFLAGKSDALTNEEKDGLETFMEAGCTSCHLGNALGGNMFQKFGIFGNYWETTKSAKIDEGKFEATKNEADKYVFKVPSLRNVVKTGPYLHDGSLTSLEETIRIMGKLQLNKELTDVQVKQIMTFLETLTGEVPAELKM